MELRPAARAALLALSLGGACDRVRPDPVVLVFGDQTLRRSDFDRHLARLEREGPLDANVRRSLFDAYVEERLLVMEARRQGLLAGPASAEDERESVQRLLADLGPATPVGPEELAVYYEEHRSELRAPETVTLRQILVSTENQARDVVRRLKKDPKSFEVLARSLSRGPEASTGGVLGSFARGQLPAELEAAGFALAVGGHSEPIQTSFGYHVLRLDAREPARERTLEECRGEILARLQGQKRDQAVREFVQGLLARAKVNHEAAQGPRRSS